VKTPTAWSWLLGVKQQNGEKNEEVYRPVTDHVLAGEEKNNKNKALS